MFKICESPMIMRGPLSAEPLLPQHHIAVPKWSAKRCLGRKVTAERAVCVIIGLFQGLPLSTLIAAEREP